MPGLDRQSGLWDQVGVLDRSNIIHKIPFNVPNKSPPIIWLTNGQLLSVNLFVLLRQVRIVVKETSCNSTLGLSFVLEIILVKSVYN